MRPTTDAAEDPTGAVPPTERERFADVGRDITLCYETFGDPADPPLVLVMGLGMQMIAWQDDFCTQLAERGLHVVRFDNRDTGRSTRIRVRPPRLHELGLRRFVRGQYALADMAQDTVGLIDALDLSPAHVVGASMGGMIAQTVAARHPQHVRSLVSIMSTTGARTVGQPDPGLLPLMLRPTEAGREAYIARSAQILAKVGSPEFPMAAEEQRARSSLSWDRGVTASGTSRQLGAILKSGDRRRELREIVAPTLVVHGAADRLVAPSGGRATARAIPGARLEEIDGMGHDLPRGIWDRLVDAIAAHAHAADERVAAASQH